MQRTVAAVAMWNLWGTKRRTSRQLNNPCPLNGRDGTWHVWMMRLFFVVVEVGVVVVVLGGVVVMAGEVVVVVVVVVL